MYKIFSAFVATSFVFLFTWNETGKNNFSATPQEDSLIAPGATVQLISKQFSFTEGPSVDKNGNVFFTDQPNDKIWKYDTDGKLTVFMDKAGRPNGTWFDKKGNLLTCAEEKDEIWSISKKGKVKILVKDGIKLSRRTVAKYRDQMNIPGSRERRAVV